MTRSPSASTVAPVLVENHRRFLAFLERRVHSRDVAEDLLQDAFVKGLAKAPPLEGAGSIVGWFYQVLRNALVDHYRRTDARARALDRLQDEPASATWPAVDEALYEAVCECVQTLVPTLKPGYADAIARMDLEGQPVQAYAADRGITPNNAAVRLHRAHKALAQRVRESCRTCADHGCRDCTCQRAARDVGRPPDASPTL